MNVLALITDAYGGNGGIALYTRTILTALSEHPSKPRITALPRVIAGPPGPVPPNVEFLVEASGGKAQYGRVLVKSLLSRRVDLIICSHLHLLPFAWLARRGRRTPVLLFVYGIEAWSPSKHRVANWLVPKVTAIVSIRQLTLDRLAAWVPLESVDVHLLENAIELDRYGPGPRDPGLERKYGLEDKRVLITVGRLAELRKGFDEVIEVLPDLLEQVPNLVYLVVGSGPDSGRLQEKARELGVEGAVVFTGQVDEDLKPDHLRLADAFAMAGSGADFDRYPARFVFLEAMATGLPVVAAAPEERAPAGTAALPRIDIDPTDRSALIDAILQALAQGPGDVPPAVRHYSVESFTRRLHAIVDSALGSGRRGSTPAQLESQGN